MDDKKKKKYIKPEADVLDFINEDIITTSNNANWVNDDNMEDWWPL